MLEVFLIKASQQIRLQLGKFANSSFLKACTRKCFLNVLMKAQLQETRCV